MNGKPPSALAMDLLNGLLCTYQCSHRFPAPHEQCLLGPPGYMCPRLFRRYPDLLQHLEEHCHHIREVLLRLWNNKLYARGNKCSFHEDTVEYLGFILLPNGLLMDPSKVSTILEWPEPCKIKDIQSFLGFANFYRRFISDCLKITVPLTHLTHKGTPWDFSEEGIHYSPGTGPMEPWRSSHCRN